MKLDKEIVTGIVICALLLIAWQPICQYFGWLPQNRPAAAEVPHPADEAQPATEVPVTPSSEAATPITAPALNLSEYSPIELKNRDLTLQISPLLGEITAITLNDYLNYERTAPVKLDQILRGSDVPGALAVFNLKLPHQVMQVISCQASERELTLVRRLNFPNFPAGIVLTQAWRLAESGYVTDYQVSFSNPGDTPIAVDSTVIGGGDLAPWQNSSGDKVRIPSHRIDYLTANGKYYDLKTDAKENRFNAGRGETVAWAAVGNKYFCSILNAEQPYQLWLTRNTTGKETKVMAAAIGAELPAFTLASGESKTFTFKYYSGPKIIDNLRAFAPDTERVMHLAWGPLDYLARALLWLLIKFKSYLHSYGLSIILLTLVVRAVFYPVTAKSNASMRKMQQVQPQLKELREKYKDNPQLMNTKMMELYRKEGVNPFGGCLPILLQIPVFFALYATLDGAVELRQVSFLWCKDLAAADTVAVIPLYFFDLPINPLVLAMTLLMMLQQRMTPMSGDPAQKKMMMMMPVIMLVFLYSLPSGLTLYWTVSNFFSIVQLKLQQRAGGKTVPAKTR